MTNSPKTPTAKDLVSMTLKVAEQNAEIGTLVEGASKGRGRSKTGHPQADRVINDAKIEKAHEAAKRAAPAKKAPAKKAPAKKAPAKKAAAPVTPKPARAPLKPVTATIQAKVPAGYVPRYTHKSYDLYSTVPGEGKIQWLVVCNAHGTHTAAAGGREGDVLGSKVKRQGWCSKCAEGKTTADVK